MSEAALAEAVEGSEKAPCPPDGRAAALALPSDPAELDPVTFMEAIRRSEP